MWIVRLSIGCITACIAVMLVLSAGVPASRLAAADRPGGEDKGSEGWMSFDGRWSGIADVGDIDVALAPDNDGQPTLLSRTSLPLDTLESIVSQINVDSMTSYLNVLQSIPNRWVTNPGNAQAEEWIMAKLEAYGYTPVLDTCAYGPYPVNNVMAYKEGISYPHYYIIIGAHFDAVPDSPGAGDDGAGVAGILEIARILKTRNTHYTFVFCFFNAEEAAVVGSSYIADRFASRGDSVAVMLNMDEISWNDFTNSHVRLFYGPNALAAQRFGSLAPSLPSVSLQAIYSGSTLYSDHYPFQSCGYTVLFTLGEPFPSPYRHTSSDSTTYVNFYYAARIIRGIMATALDIDDQFKPSLGLMFEYPDGLPDSASATTETFFRVQVSGIAGGVPATGSGELHYSVDGEPYVDVPMADLGNGLYGATIPAPGCNYDRCGFYVSAQESGGSTFYDPSPSNPVVIPITTNRVTAYSDDFEIDRGWSLFEGLWAIGSPTGAWGEMAAPDPVGGHNSVNCLAYNLDGDYENNLPARRVISPVIDCSGLSNVHLKFWRWLGVEYYGFDNARIGVSYNGTTFTYVWGNSQQTSGGYWMEDEVDISAIADNQATVYIEFVMGPTDGGWRYCGWNVDDLEVYGYECHPPFKCGDANGDGKITSGDAIYIISYIFRGGSGPNPVGAADANCDSKINSGDAVYIISYIFRGGPAPCCP